MSDSSHVFSAAKRAAVYRIITERRGMCHFSGGSVALGLLMRLLKVVHQAPSIGLMQPWCFIRITEPALRRAIHGLVEGERGRIAEALDERSDEFMRLKVEGVLSCVELLVAALMDDRKRHVFGRRTLPQMDLASLVRAIRNPWLVSRAESLGMGWVSLFDPAALSKLLGLSPGSEVVAVLCLGPMAEFYPAPMLTLKGWSEPHPLAELVYQNR